MRTGRNWGLVRLTEGGRIIRYYGCRISIGTLHTQSLSKGWRGGV